MNRFVLVSTSILSLAISTACVLAADPPSDIPKAVPATRPEMKKALESLKDRTPRLPLPESGEGGVNNGRMRATYLPEGWGGGGGRGGRDRQRARDGRGGFGRFGQDPNSTMDFAFTTSLFWVVSRGNNCHYCLGHQELKLRGAGLNDDTIASLDSDWSIFDPRQQAALAYARKLTLEPQLVGDQDIADLKKLFTDAEIIELTYNISRFNATNRWTDGMGIPQDQRFGEEDSSLDTPTNERFQNTVSIATPQTRASRPGPPSILEAMQAMAVCHNRSARVELPSEEKAAAALAGVVEQRDVRNWERAMAQLAGTGPSQVATLNTIMTDEHLSPRLKAELFLISAANNRAWYAVGHAACRLHSLGASHEDMAGLISDEPKGEAAAAYRLAAKLTASPHLITDADIAQVREKFSDAETAQIVQVICMANMFDRFTEALGLPLEEGLCH
jgi:alkylhydroperoxidase family enzyme